jgi:hypothetical protein
MPTSKQIGTPVEVDPLEIVRQADTNKAFELTVSTGFRTLMVVVGASYVLGFTVLIGIGRDWLSFPDDQEIARTLIRWVLAPGPILAGIVGLARAFERRGK